MRLPILNSSPCAKHGCAACCYDTEMPLLEEDVARLVRLGHDRAAFTRVGVDDGFLYLATRPRPEGMSDAGRSEADIKAGKPGRPCFFLQDNACSVYADRPTGCRIYPFVMTEDGRRVLPDEDCPHAREFPQDPSLLRRIQKIAARMGREAAKR